MYGIEGGGVRRSSHRSWGSFMDGTQASLNLEGLTDHFESVMKDKVTLLRISEEILD